ncbi:telomere-protecting terminal protein Tpg [Streptomyces albus]|uniref:telomere-protecting terminal protein Tpg n=1 Tax=Streptomyces sp. NRRL F-5639 TaxID=1463867 RepID=UPI003B634EBD
MAPGPQAGDDLLVPGQQHPDGHRQRLGGGGRRHVPHRTDERRDADRPAPKSAKAQVKFLLTRVKGSTQALAERPGVSRRTVERYRAGKLTTPQKRLQAALVEETESEWQPQVRAQVREQAATSSGMMVDVTAYFGFTGKGSSDDGRERQITTAISPT